MKTNVIIITGQIAALKTTLAKSLAEDLSAVALCKDDVKEILSEVITAKTRKENQDLSKAAVLLMEHQLLKIISFVSQIIIEANFKEAEYDRLIQTLNEKNITHQTFYLYGTFDVLYERYLKRFDGLHETHKSMGKIAEDNFKASMAYYHAIYKDKPSVIQIDTSIYDETLYKSIKTRVM